MLKAWPARPSRCWRNSTRPGLVTLTATATATITGANSTSSRAARTRVVGVLQHARQLPGELTGDAPVDRRAFTFWRTTA